MKKIDCALNAKKAFLVSLLMFCGISGFTLLSAESFRVSKVHEVSVAQSSESEAVAKLGINEALAIALPADQTFIEGLELKFDIPEAVGEIFSIQEIFPAAVYLFPSGHIGGSRNTCGRCCGGAAR